MMQRLCSSVDDLYRTGNFSLRGLDAEPVQDAQHQAAVALEDACRRLENRPGNAPSDLFARRRIQVGLTVGTNRGQPLVRLIRSRYARTYGSQEMIDLGLELFTLAQ